MLVARFRPLGTWPGTPTKSRRSSTFKAAYLKTLDLLEKELGQIGARELTIYCDVNPSQIRNDGWLKANASPSSPGIVLEFELPDKTKVTMPCDTFNHWQDNLRGIALSLEALRAVNRYGVTKHGEQYKGFKALPPPANSGSGPIVFVDRQSAAMALEAISGNSINMSDPASIELAFKSAVKAHHPDIGGNRHQYEIALEARKVLLQ